MEQSSVSKALFKKCDEVAEVMSSLAHPTRLKVLCSLMSGEQAVGDLTEICGISQPAMSQFLNRMKEDGMIASRKEGKKVLYSLADKKLLKLLAAVKDTYCG